MRRWQSVRWRTEASFKYEEKHPHPMAITFYNSLTKRLEPFEPVTPGTATMYNCGPTVYNRIHIGNLRAFLFADLLRRYLKFRGLTVMQVMNITDVGHMTSDADEGEDKMEAAAKREQLDPWKIAEKYTKLFMEDIGKLGILPADEYPRATDHVQEMIAIIQELIAKGLAYEAGGNIYFDVTKAEKYGKLSGNTLDRLQAQKRSVDDTNKRNAQDFVLWFSNSKYENHIMKWNSPWGEGYPGWHIECSAMSMRYLSDAFSKGFGAFEPIDIHTGGEDNKFPHHECEIAQSEGVTGKPFVKYWLHVRHLMVEGKKMSKSVGNFYTLPDLIEQGHTMQAIRYELAATHYRQQLNFTQDGLTAAQHAIDRIQETIFALQHAKGDGSSDAQSIIDDGRAAFIERMDEDLNVSGGLAALFETIKRINKSVDAMDVDQAASVLDFLKEIDSVLGIMEFSGGKAIDSEIESLIVQRDAAREAKDWAEADRIRDLLSEKGITLIDAKDGTRWKRG